MKPMRIQAFLFLISLSPLFFLQSSTHTDHFKKAIIWGHKLHTHTHSYAHYGFYKAFKQMGFDTYWFDDEDDVSNFDFSNSLFLTKGQADNAIPLRNDCFYFVHNGKYQHYKELLDNNRCIFFQVFTFKAQDTLNKMDDYVYYHLKQKLIHIPWATDLLPHEIDEIKKNISLERQKVIYYVGTVYTGEFSNLDKVNSFKNACRENKIIFKEMQKVDLEEHIKLIQQSYMAPCLQGEWQLKTGYIPGRFFQNISYGQFPVTNSKLLFDITKGKAIYNPDPYELFKQAEQRLATLSKEELFSLMDFVRDNHTYINRIENLLTFMNMVLAD